MVLSSGEEDADNDRRESIPLSKYAWVRVFYSHQNQPKVANKQYLLHVNFEFHYRFILDNFGGKDFFISSLLFKDESTSSYYSTVEVTFVKLKGIPKIL